MVERDEIRVRLGSLLAPAQKRSETQLDTCSAANHAAYHLEGVKIVEKVVFVPCVFRRGAFPHERIFIIHLDGDWEYRGVAPVNYCLKSDSSPLGDLPPADRDVEGKILGIQITPSADGAARVQLPDGEVYELPEDRFESPSRAEGPYVSVES